MPRMEELFGSNVFNDEVMQRRLPRETYKALHKTIADGRPLKATLKRIRKAPVNEDAPVMSLLTALIREAIEEV